LQHLQAGLLKLSRHFLLTNIRVIRAISAAHGGDAANSYKYIFNAAYLELKALSARIECCGAGFINEQVRPTWPCAATTGDRRG
jgi:hypothetical protein